MKAAGFFLIAVGPMCAAIACFLPVSVRSEASYRFSTYTAASDVLNIGLLQLQELVFIGGCTLFLAGAVLAGAGAVIEALGSATARSSTLGGSQPVRTSLPISSEPVRQRTMEEAITDEGTFKLAIGAAVLAVVLLAAFFFAGSA